MVSNPPLEDIYYLSIIFRAMKDLFKVKLLDPLDDEFYFINEIISKTPNNQYSLNKSTLQNRFFEILTFAELKKTFELQEKSRDFSLSDKLANVDYKNKFKTQDFSIFEKENISLESSKDPFVVTKKPIDYKNKKDQNKDFFIKSFFKKESPFKVKNYFNSYEKKNFLKDVKLSIEFFKEKSTDFQRKITDEKMDTNNIFDNKNKLLSLKDSDKILIIKGSLLEESFLQAIKGQAHTISNNKIESLIPFAVVGYHFKENEKNTSLRRKKKKKKVLFKREIKYLKEQV